MDDLAILKLGPYNSIAPICVRDKPNERIGADRQLRISELPCTSAEGPGCVKTPTSNLRLETRSGSHRRKKKREKTILRILCSCTFSHSLGQFRTSARF